MNLKKYQKDEIIFRQGEFAVTMFEICSGSVGIYADYGEENEKQLAVLTQDQVFGEMGLVECYPRSATAVAMSDDVQVREISAEEFSDLFRDKPEKVFSILQQMSRRLRETNANYMEACKAVYDADAAEKAGEEKSQKLMESLRRIFDIYASYNVLRYR